MISRQRVFKALEQTWLASSRQLARIYSKPALSTHSMLAQTGRVIYDLEKQVYRKRSWPGLCHLTH